MNYWDGLALTPSILPTVNPDAMECIGAIDQGTQSTRFCLYDRDLTLVASSQVSVSQKNPKAGWAEQDPEEVWESVVTSVQEALQRAEKECGVAVRVVGVGIANQRETTVLWDSHTGKPLHNAIVWHDSRTSDVCARVAESRGRNCFQQATGLPVSTYFSAYKIMWLQENIPNVKRAVDEGRCMFGTMDSWIIFKLTRDSLGGDATASGKHVTDVTNASRTGLMNIHTLGWDKNITNILGVQNVTFPDILSNSDDFGYVVSLPELCGVPITGCIGDQQSATLGHRCKKGEAKNTYGTGCFVLLNTGTDINFSTHGLLTTVLFKLGRNQPAHYALEGSIASAGQGISWLRDSLKLISSSEESEIAASSALDCGGVVFVPAFAGLLAPWWVADAKGCVLGLSYSTERAHIVRAMLAAICFQSKDVLDSMRKDSSLEELKRLFVDGGASSNNLLMQMQADVLGIPIIRPQNTETTALGAAIAAGIGISWWTTDDIFQGKHADPHDRFCRKVQANEVERHHSAWKEAVRSCIEVSPKLEGANVI